MMERLAIVGAGIAGLAVAAEMLDDRAVTLIDRLPAVGALRWSVRHGISCISRYPD